MGSESNNNHSDNLQSSMWNYTLDITRRLVACRAALLSSCRDSWLLSPLLSRCPLVLSSRHLLASPLIVLSLHRPLIVSLRRLVVVASPLVALPSRPLVTTHSRPLVVLLLRRCLAVSSRRLVVASPLITLLSRPLVVLSLRRPLII